MGTTTETRITSTQAKDAIYKAHELVGQDLVTQSELDAVVLGSGNITPEQAITINNLSGLVGTGLELDYLIDNKKYPMSGRATKVLSDAVLDVNIIGGNKAWRVGITTLDRAYTSTGHYIRLGVYKEDNTLDTSVGASGIIGTFYYALGTYAEPTAINGKILDELTFTVNDSSIKSIKMLLDWSKIPTNVHHGVSSFLVSGLSSLVFRDNKLDKSVKADTILSSLPSSIKTPFYKDVSFDSSNLNNFILSASIYGATSTKRYGIELVQFTPLASSRSFVGVREYNTDGSNGVRVALFDNTSYVLPTLVNGRRLATLVLSPSSSSGVTVVLDVDWEALPKSGSGWNGTRFYLNTFTIGNAQLSYDTYKIGAIPTTGSSVIDFTIDGKNARLTTSAGYGNGQDDYLLILLHGNGQDEKYTPSTAFVNFCKANKISFCAIKAQDEISSPFTTSSTGWGNQTYISRYTKLYNYLISNYKFHKSVILAGSSMGGLAMGHFAYTKPFPILFCLGIGAVPSLEYIFNNGGNSRKEPIRQAYGMNSNGSDDGQLSQFTQGYDWFKMGKVEIAGIKYQTGFPRMYLYLGTGDTTATVDFGGIAKYNEIKTAIENGGGYCKVTDIGASYTHNDNQIYDVILSDNIMQRELNI